MAELFCEEVQTAAELTAAGFAGKIVTSKLEDAFQAASEDYSPDRVVADSRLNAQFISECRKQGLTESVATLNRELLNLRKRGGLSGRPRSKRTHFSDDDEYRFAAEVAVRFLERRDGISLDGILCDPKLATEFDELASRIAPGYEPLKYRWAALRLRKTARLKPELISRVAKPNEVLTVAVDELDPSILPITQGLYLLYMSTALLYVGENANLRRRVR